MNDQINQLEQLEKDLYVQAFNSGCSIVMIGRTLGFDNMGRVYRVLREYGAVSKLAKNQRYELPVVLEATFCKIKMSFAQWCNSHGVNAKVAEIAIKLGHWETKDPEHRHVLGALKSDFHNLYLDLYGIGNELDRRYPADRPASPRHSLLIEWSYEDDGYLASIPQLPEIIGYGATWDSALAELKYLYNVKRRITKLEELITGQG